MSETYGYIEEEDGENKLVNLSEVGYEYEREFGEPEAVGWILEFDVDEVCRKKGTYKELLSISKICQDCSHVERGVTTHLQRRGKFQCSTA